MAGGIMKPDQSPALMVFGDIKFTQVSANSPVQIAMNVTMFPAQEPLANAMRGLHIHQFGISDMNHEPSVMCDSTGPHFNPTGSPHGQHAGDLGNVQPAGGRLFLQIQSSAISLVGPNSIVGRSVVLHERIDDNGRGGNEASLKNGNAGKRIACGTIGLMKA
jgi:Cu/Zn superoxide dismutase